MHILVSLSLVKKSLTSEELAWSTATNPSMVRRILGMLSRTNLVTTQSGAAGGAMLARNAESISLLEVLDAVDLKPSIVVHQANPECTVGKVIDGPIENVLESANTAARDVFEKTSIAQVAEETRLGIVKSQRKLKNNR